MLRHIQVRADVAARSAASQVDDRPDALVALRRWLSRSPHPLIPPVPAYPALPLAGKGVGLHVGMGGSVNGARALWGAAQAQQEVHFVDGLDRDRLSYVLGRVEHNPGWIHFVSKSGETSEVLAVANEIAPWIAARPPIARWTFASTAKADSALGQLARQNGWNFGALPDYIGGRYGVFTPAATGPLQLYGLPTSGYLEAAGRVFESIEHDEGAADAVRLLSAELGGHKVCVLLAYAEPLCSALPWLVQILAESLGKMDIDGNPRLLYPISARGPSDQHALLQLLLNDPADHRLVVIRPRSPLSGNAMDVLAHRSALATVAALGDRLVPVVDIAWERICPEALGETIALFIAATVHRAFAWGIDPFDQPAVEWIKQHVRTSESDGGAALERKIESTFRRLG